MHVVVSDSNQFERKVAASLFRKIPKIHHNRVKLMLHPIQKVRKIPGSLADWTVIGEEGDNFRPGRVLIGPPV